LRFLHWQDREEEKHSYGGSTQMLAMARIEFLVQIFTQICFI
jgi:hypothetical protein